MKSIGIVRKLNSLGRVSIPIEVRQKLNISGGDLFEITVRDNSIVLSKYSSAECLFCGSENWLKSFKGRAVCYKCLIAAEIIGELEE